MKKILIILVVCSIALIGEGSQDVNSWIGRWKFTECWPHISGKLYDCVVYVLNVKQTDEKVIVDVDIDGYQSLRRIRGEGKLSNVGIQIIFSGVREGDWSGEEIYEKGDMLLELSKSNNKVLTTWKKIKPELDEHQEPGVYFQKVTP